VFEVAIIASAWALFLDYLGVFNSLIIHKVEKFLNNFIGSTNWSKKNTRESQK